MDIAILIPEEEILAWFEKALGEELPEMIQTINEERGEIWAEDFTEVSKTCNTTARLPKAFIQISKVKKKTVEINFTREEYMIELKISFQDNEYRSAGYRYNYLINKLIKESIDLQNIADKIIIDELIYNQNQRGDEREPSTAEFKIIITRETA